MALTWDLTEIKDSQKICWIPATDEEGKVEMGALTTTLIWATIFVGMNRITEKNSKEFHKRLIECEIIQGRGMLIEHNELDKKTRQPTLEEVQSHIGLKTNAVFMNSRQWGINIKRMVKEEATKRIGG